MNEKLQALKNVAGFPGSLHDVLSEFNTRLRVLEAGAVSDRQRLIGIESDLGTAFQELAVRGAAVDPPAAVESLEGTHA